MRLGESRALFERFDIPGVDELDPVGSRKDWDGLAAVAPDRVVLSWDTRHIPPERLDMANRILSQPE
jgi:hypothetical protein